MNCIFCVYITRKSKFCEVFDNKILKTKRSLHKNAHPKQFFAISMFYHPTPDHGINNDFWSGGLNRASRTFSSWSQNLLNKLKTVRIAGVVSKCYSSVSLGSKDCLPFPIVHCLGTSRPITIQTNSYDRLIMYVSSS